MIKRYSFLTMLFLLTTAFCDAQFSEVEPNDSFAGANNLNLDASMSGIIGEGTDKDDFRIVLPVDGLLRIYSTVTAPGPNTPQNFSIVLASHDGQYWNTFSPAMGVNGEAIPDTFQWCCLKADTFYLQVQSSWGFPIDYNYTFSCELVPATYGNDDEPNMIPGPSISLGYNTPIEGHLSFMDEPIDNTDGNDYYELVVPADGVMRVFVDVEAQSSASNNMTVGLYDIGNGALYDQFVTPGPFHDPHSDTLYWSCIAADTMHLQVSVSNFSDHGYSYKLRYDMVAPVFGNDVEPNNNYAHAQLISPDNVQDGHLYFHGDGASDYYKFAKPDTGYMRLYIQSETSNGTTSGGTYVEIYDHNQNYLGEVDSEIGINGVPVLDSLYFAELAADTFYIHVLNGSGFAPCVSYRITLLFANSLGISENTMPEPRLYPNPGNGNFYVNTQGLNGRGTLQVYDIFGAMVLSESINFPGVKEVNLQSAGSGIYFARISAGDKQYMQKLVIR